MTDAGTLVQIERVEALERELAETRRAVARSLRYTRETASLSLRDVAPKVRLTPAALSNIERGESWKTKTIRRVAKFYDSAA